MDLYSCFVINLKRRQERKKNMQAILPENFNVIFTSDFHGPFDGKTMRPSDIKNYRLYDWKIESNNKWWNRDLKKGEIGCAISRYFCWKLALQKDYLISIFLEDDVTLANNFQYKFNQLLYSVNNYDISWDMIYLGRSRVGKDTPINNFIVKPGYSYSSRGYVMSKKGLIKILKARYDQNIIPVDEFLPALYMNHPREDIRSIFKSCMQVYAPIQDIVFHRKDSFSDTEESDYIGSEYNHLIN